MVDVAILSCTFILSVSCIVYFLSNKQLQKVQSYLFLAIMINVSVSAVADIISNYIENSLVATGTLFRWQYATQIIFFLAHTTLAPLYALYVMMVNGSGLNRKNSFFYLILSPLVISELLLITNPLTNWMFYYDKYADFVRGPYEFILYITAALYLFISMYFMLRYRKAVSRETNIALWYFFSFTIIGIIVQMINSEFKVELFAESVSMLGVMLTIENEDALIDSGSMVYNRAAFTNENVRLLCTGQHYAVISVNMTNLRFYTRILDYNAMRDVVRMIAAWLRSCNKNVRVYRNATNNMTLILLYKNEKEVDALVSTIADRFRDTWIYGRSEIELNAEIRVAYVPEEFNDVNLLTELTESNSDIETPGVRVFRGDELDSFKRKAQVEEALKKALEEDTFQVYYQPIWNAEKNRMESAEALIRLTDSELGFISPEEFIPIAEQSGLITEIGLYVFEKVCQFITKERTKALGLKYIEVNLSIFQLLVGNTLEHFLEIMKRYGVTSDQINLEITETGSLATSNTMISAINEMQEWGFKFSLDDYGTGYSNLSYIMSMDFLNIKSDKGLLWDADTRESSSIMLTDTIKTIRRLGMNVIQEGVETKEQLDLVVGAGANLIQGYYFSKPLPEEAFYDYMVEFIKNSIINR